MKARAAAGRPVPINAKERKTMKIYNYTVNKNGLRETVVVRQIICIYFLHIKCIYF